MLNKRINPILWIGLTGTLIIGTAFFADVYQAFWGDYTMWWTHQSRRLPLEKTKDNFELYIHGKLLQRHLSEKTLFSVDNEGKQYPVVSEDITVRLNNWDKVKSSILTNMTMSGFGFGACITLLLVGLVQSFHHGKMTEREGG